MPAEPMDWREFARVVASKHDMDPQLQMALCALYDAEEVHAVAEGIRIAFYRRLSVECSAMCW